jgi:8-oxo-dGTP pyrophosphatase MutT (NUDIX family)
VEEDEAVFDALRREVLEETGLAVSHATLLGVFSDPTRIIEYPDGSINRVLSVAFVVASESRDVTVSDESLELRFVDRAALASAELWPAATPVRDAYLAGQGVVVA